LTITPKHGHLNDIHQFFRTFSSLFRVPLLANFFPFPSILSHPIPNIFAIQGAISVINSFGLATGPHLITKAIHLPHNTTQFTALRQINFDCLLPFTTRDYFGIALLNHIIVN
jgi:hypothetical protein